MNVAGLCLHMNCTGPDPSVYARALANARVVYDEALQRGFHLRSINVGGGFTSTILRQLLMRFATR